MSSPPPPTLPDQRLFTGVARLAARHEGRLAPETVQRLLADSYALLAADAQVHTHLVVRAERLTAERLGALAKVQGAPGTEPVTEPATVVDPHVVQALTEVGADVSAAYPKPLTDEVVQAADIVITMGCGDACPIVPGRRHLDRPVPDPEGAPIAVVREIREIRDEIDAHITELLTRLGA
ncbi:MULTISPECIES: arsenate reductase ArsC [unclassified Streptomyces]|uniref:arsenate reductase/protein-tyrosine-phosphatase family protein n=1 Tax=unclassified Streptomyces TaxID=2593676 RepID=UPI000DC7B9DB|nr:MULTISPECIES: arsenate reductase ArsC [unclassified Streptomyces]AWZ04471.1 arsenate reductase ArsC [Streptomyces sp. ICC4]AWZ12120.1 arsenate reductase ArsC [Streptomyces sp. ICC1]